MGAVMAAAVETPLILGCEAWPARNVDDSGQMTYKFWPSPGETPDANNMLMVRQSRWGASPDSRYEDDGPAA
jgi:hypothetical protein